MYFLTYFSALSLPDKKPSQLKPDSEEGEEIFDGGNGLGIPGILDEEKDCSCKKDDRLEKEKKQREKDIQFQINFEDALHNQVYVKRFVDTFWLVSGIIKIVITVLQDQIIGGIFVWEKSSQFCKNFLFHENHHSYGEYWEILDHLKLWNQFCLDFCTIHLCKY